MEIGLDLRNFETFEDRHKAILISMLFSYWDMFFILTKANNVPWNTIQLFRRE